MKELSQMANNKLEAVFSADLQRGMLSQINLPQQRKVMVFSATPYNIVPTIYKISKITKISCKQSISGLNMACITSKKPPPSSLAWPKNL